MCRLAGLVATSSPAADADEALPLLPVWQHLVAAPHSLRIQADNGAVWKDGPDAERGHKDSWGIGWFDAAGQASLLRQTGSAGDSAYFVFASEAASRGGGGSGPATAAIGHLRKASCGTITTENAHPIRADYTDGLGRRSALMVAHNGTLKDPLLQTLRDELAEAGRPEAGSDAATVSDTVILAGWLALRAEGAADLFVALSGALAELFRRAAELAPNGDLAKVYSGVNLLIGAPDGLLALRQFSHSPNYYTLSARPLTPADGGAAAGWVIASEPTDDSRAWEPLPPGLLVFYPTAGTGVVRTHSVA